MMKSPVPQNDQVAFAVEAETTIIIDVLRRRSGVDVSQQPSPYLIVNII